MRLTNEMWVELSKALPLLILFIIAVCCLVFIPELHTVGIVIACIFGIIIACFVVVLFCIMAKDGYDNFIHMYRDRRRIEEERERTEERRREQERRNMQRRAHIPDEHFRVD